MNTLVTGKKIVHHPSVFERMDNGIVRVSTVAGVEEFEVTRAFVDDTVAIIGKLSGNRPCRMLFCLDNVYLRMDHDVREYIVNHREGNRLKIAEAIVTMSLATRILTNFYFVFHRPPRPGKLFSKEEKAVAWLLTFPEERRTPEQ